MRSDMEMKSRSIELRYDFKLISKDNSKAFNPITRRVYLDPKYKAFEDRIRWETKSQYHGKPLEGNLQCEIWAFFKDNRRCDAGNLPKSCLDALQGILFLNDKQVIDLKVFIKIEKKDCFRVDIKQI
jgi:Holliday junction resolvase RusA-like endonuclease